MKHSRCFSMIALRWLALGLLVLSATTATADKTGDRKRTQLANVQRLLVVPPFFGTDTLGALDSPDSSGTKKPAPAKPLPNIETYREQLRRLEDHARAHLPKRVAARTPFQVVPAEELKAALKELDLTPSRLFRDQGRMRGARFPVPDEAAVRKLATRLKADAVLLDVMDEPRRTNGHYYIDVYGINYESGHVRAKSGFFLLLPDGSEVLHEYIESMHPLTRSGNSSYLLADWQETTEQVIEDFLNELTRYTPEKTVAK